MAECPQEDEEDQTPGYKAPAQKSLSEIASQDTEDESLRRYKETLLGNISELPAGTGKGSVTVKSLSVVVKGREDISLDLTGDLTQLKDTPIGIKEGTEYKLKVKFIVTGEIVSGLRLHTTIHKGKIKVQSQKHMLGSFGPKSDLQESSTQVETAPSGIVSRGQFTAKSAFKDDDFNNILSWEWILDIHKKWPEEKEKK